MNPQHLVCPDTKEALTLEASALKSPSGKIYRVRQDGKVDFRGLREQLSTQRQDPIDQAKSWVKHRLGRHYNLLVDLISPVMPRICAPPGMNYLQRNVDEFSAGKQLVIQVGSGNNRLSPDIKNIDMFDYPEVDIIADGAHLPFADNSVDVFITIAVLEHVPDPHSLLKEAYRTLKPGGVILSAVPFLQGFHASPYDFTRWTMPGLKQVHEQFGFSTIKCEPASGPTSSFLWVAQEWLAMLLSFNIQPLYYFWLGTLMLVTAPLKILDLFLVHHRQAHRIASTFLFVGKK